MKPSKSGSFSISRHWGIATLLLPAGALGPGSSRAGTEMLWQEQGDPQATVRSDGAAPGPKQRGGFGPLPLGSTEHP